ncbi:coproporphyrinogen-III oxidase family protein [uncultured Roseobacter sp.]|uniref:coproporphyrinogen-III oxidase family protein n=1 Tax=uncultured Roseobacter sp. TaxID=114847 RepID=UPI00262C0F22|nr:coproporphyrinogen-III oxidase family protein [uncultured Roseobacter sp.]
MNDSMEFIHPLYHWPPRFMWREKRHNSLKWGNTSVYLHYPFCRYLCDFCGYETRLVNGRVSKTFPVNLAQQINFLANVDDFSAANLESVFFGGGTASIIPEKAIAKILHQIDADIGDTRTAEVTLECEPGTIKRQKLLSVQKLGVSRISVCAQSFDDTVLQRSGRKHTAADALDLVDMCSEIGFQDIHVDLIYGLPGQSWASWVSTIDLLVKLPIHHVSIYKLYVYRHGKLDRAASTDPAISTMPPLDELKAMHDYAQQALQTNGFDQYTLTEYARCGHQSRYIDATFGQSDVMPIGPGAFGKCGVHLWENEPSIPGYAANSVKLPAHALELTPFEAFRRSVILGLWRLGVDLAVTAAKFGVHPSRELYTTLHQLAREGFIHLTGDVITLATEQRFNAGLVMDTLAQLPIGQWCSDAPAAESVDLLRNDTPHVRKITTLLKMARRDRELYSEIVRDPTNALMKYGVPVDTPEAVEIIAIILGAQKSIDRPLLLSSWNNVLEARRLDGDGRAAS